MDFITDILNRGSNPKVLMGNFNDTPESEDMKKNIVH